MSHRNSPLSPTGRLRLARCVVDDRWPLRRAADRFNVSVTTAKRWRIATVTTGRPEWVIGPAGPDRVRIAPAGAGNAGSSGYASPAAGGRPGSDTTWG